MDTSEQLDNLAGTPAYWEAIAELKETLYPDTSGNLIPARAFNISEGGSYPQGLELHPAGTRDRLTALEAENDRLKNALRAAGLVPPLDDQLQPVDDETVRLKNANRDSKIAHDITVGMLRNANEENARLQDEAKEALALVAYFVNHWPAAHPPDAITRQMLDEAWAMITVQQSGVNPQIEHE